MRIWKGLASYDGRAALSTWIYAITRNRCLTALSRRRVLVLYYFEGRSVDEVARMLACPGGTVKARLFRARALRMQRLQSEGVADPALWLENT